MDECIDIRGPEFDYLDSEDDWLNPVRGSYSARVKSLDINKWLNEAFVKESSPVIVGTNGNLSNGTARVIDQRTRRIQPSPCRRPGIPNMGSTETPPDAPTTQEIRVINTNTVTKGVERTKTFTRKQREEQSSFIKNATITKARIARRGTFSRGQMPFNSNPFNLTGSNDRDDQGNDTYNLDGENVDNCDDDQSSSPNDFNGGYEVSSSTPTNHYLKHQSTNELNRQGTITKKILPSSNMVRPSNGYHYPNGISAQQSLLNACSAPNLAAARSREQIIYTATTYNHGTITKSSSRILANTRIPKSNSNSRESLNTTIPSTSNLPRLRPPTMVKPFIRK